LLICRVRVLILLDGVSSRLERVLICLFFYLTWIEDGVFRRGSGFVCRVSGLGGGWLRFADRFFTFTPLLPMISGPSSYPSTIREFVEHWEAVDLTLGGAGPLVLAGDISRENLSDQGENLDDARDNVTDARVDRTLARQQLNGLIVKLQGKLVEFNKRVRADLAGTAYERSLPVAFAIGDAESTVREALRYMSRLWSKVNAILPVPAGVTLPMVLMESYTLALFDADREALRLGYQTLTNADVELKLARERRNDLQDVIYPILKAYRLKVPTALPAGHALLDSLPLLTPPEGHTPAPVAVQAAWNAGTTMADITWAESTDADLESYEVRGVPGDEYDAEDEVVLATVPKGGARTFSTDFALGTPGLSAAFKVYVVLDSGRERGSEAVVVARPV
jgi:hypothetical protein